MKLCLSWILIFLGYCTINLAKAENQPPNWLFQTLEDVTTSLSTDSAVDITSAATEVSSDGTQTTVETSLSVSMTDSETSAVKTTFEEVTSSSAAVTSSSSEFVVSSTTENTQLSTDFTVDSINTSLSSSGSYSSSASKSSSFTAVTDDSHESTSSTTPITTLETDGVTSSSETTTAAGEVSTSQLVTTEETSSVHTTPSETLSTVSKASTSSVDVTAPSSTITVRSSSQSSASSADTTSSSYSSSTSSVTAVTDDSHESTSSTTSITTLETDEIASSSKTTTADATTPTSTITVTSSSQSSVSSADTTSSVILATSTASEIPTLSSSSGSEMPTIPTDTTYTVTGATIATSKTSSASTSATEPSSVATDSTGTSSATRDASTDASPGKETTTASPSTPTPSVNTVSAETNTAPTATEATVTTSTLTIGTTPAGISTPTITSAVTTSLGTGATITHTAETSPVSTVSAETKTVPTVTEATVTTSTLTVGTTPTEISTPTITSAVTTSLGTVATITHTAETSPVSTVSAETKTIPTVTEATVTTSTLTVGTTPTEVSTPTITSAITTSTGKGTSTTPIAGTTETSVATTNFTRLTDSPTTVTTTSTTTSPTTACHDTIAVEPCIPPYNGNMIVICECGAVDCRLNLTGCSNPWLPEIDCSKMHAFDDIAAGVGDGIFLQHEIDDILIKLEECRGEVDGANVMSAAAAAVKAVDGIFTSKAWEILPEFFHPVKYGFQRNSIQLPDKLIALEVEQLILSSAQVAKRFCCRIEELNPSLHIKSLQLRRKTFQFNYVYRTINKFGNRSPKKQHVQRWLSYRTRRYKDFGEEIEKDEEFLFNETSILIPASGEERNIVAYGILDRNIAPASENSYGSNGRTNSPLLGVSFVELGKSSLRNSQLGNGQNVILSFKNFLKVQGPYHVVRRSLFEGEEPTVREGSMECSFLVGNSDPTSHPFWGTAGCRVISSTVEQTNCSCERVGTFVTIGQVHQFERLPFELDIVWYVFTILSIVCCLFSVIVLIARPPIKQNKIGQIKRFGLLNLLFCITVTDFMILLFMNKSKFPLDNSACTAVGALLHYFALASFTWVTVEAFVLLREARSPAEFTTIRSLVYLPIGYIFPGLFVAAALLEAHFIELDLTQAYTDSAVCWLTSPDYVWNFYAPALFLTIVDGVIMIYAVDSAYKVAEKKQTFVSKAVGSWWKSSVGIALLLAATWTFGFFILDENIEMEYIFIVLNGLQGLFLLISTVLTFKKEAKVEEKDKEVIDSPIVAYDNSSNDPAFPPVMLRSRFGGPDRPREVSNKYSDPEIDYNSLHLPRKKDKPQGQFTLETLPPPGKEPLIPRVSIKPRDSAVYSAQQMPGRKLGAERDNFGFVSDTEASMGKKSARNDEYKQKVTRYDPDVYY